MWQPSGGDAQPATRSPGDRYHDWASLVIYASLPLDYATQVRTNRYKIAEQSVKVLRARAEALLAGSKLNPEDVHARTAHPKDDKLHSCERLFSGIDAEQKALEAFADDEAEATGMRASLEKVRAELLFFAGSLDSTQEDRARDYKRRSLLSLESARRLYRSALLHSLSHHWQAVQYLALTHVLREAGIDVSESPRGLFDVAWVAAEIDRDREDGKERAFAEGSLAELCLLKALVNGSADERDAICAAQQHIKNVLEHETPGGFAVQSTRRQLVRYQRWWSTLPCNPESREHMRGLATPLIELLNRGLGYCSGGPHQSSNHPAGAANTKDNDPSTQRLA